MNDRERELWVMNDEFLYTRFLRSSRRTELAYARNNRAVVDAYIETFMSAGPDVDKHALAAIAAEAAELRSPSYEIEPGMVSYWAYLPQLSRAGL